MAFGGAEQSKCSTIDIQTLELCSKH